MITPHTIEGFTGLNIGTDPFEVGAAGAVDAVNVKFDVNGAIRTRPGYTSFATVAQPGQLHRAKQGSGAGRILVADLSSPTLYAFNEAGASVASQVGANPSNFVNFGSPTGSVAYYALSAASFGKWDGAAFTIIAPGYGGGRVGVNPTRTRLVLANDGTNVSRLQFSDAGLPETYTANNYVDLSPGDGEGIAELIWWRDLLFAFKRSKFFVFYGESTDTDGEPVFNYRAVDVGIGAHTSSNTTSTDTYAQAVATPHGVFFVGPDGIYVTTGDKPVKVSAALDPWFRGQTIENSSLPTYAPPLYISYAGGLIYVTTSTATKTIVHDPVGGWWSIYSKAILSAIDMPMAGLATRQLWAVNATAVFAHEEARTTDNGTGIAWSYISGRYSLSGDPGRVASTLESSVVGSGTVSLRNTTDVYGADASATSMTLGTAPARAESWHLVDNEGTWFQHTLSGTGIAQVNRLTHYVASVKPSGVR